MSTDSLLAVYLAFIALPVLAVFVICAWKDRKPHDTVVVMVLAFVFSLFWPIIGAFMLP